LVERRVKRDIVVPPSVNELALRDGNRHGMQTPEIQVNQKARSNIIRAFPR